MLVDFVPEINGSSLSYVPSFQKAAGGAPANVAAAVAKLGGKSRFIGKIGADAFGSFLRSSLVDIGVQKLMDKGVRAVIVTSGQHGCRVITKKER